MIEHFGEDPGELRSSLPDITPTESTELMNSMVENPKTAIGSDLQNFIALYRSVGIVLEPKNGEGGSSDQFYLKLEVGDPHIRGYMGFVTMIWFDENGKFLEQLIVE